MQEESRRKPISGCVFMCAWMRALTPPDFAPSLQTSGSGQTHSDQTKSHSRQAHLRSPLLSSVRDLYFCQSFYSSVSPSLCWLQFLLSLSFPTVSSLVFLLCVCVCVCVCVCLFNAFPELCRKLSSQHFSVKDVDTTVCVCATLLF